MTRYRQLTSGERHELSALRKQGFRPAAIARALGRHRSTICRELRRNTRKDGGYRPATADQRTRGRRSKSRRNRRFSAADWALVERWILEDFSPEQISGWLRRFRLLSISHETIYRYVWDDKALGGTLHRRLRGANKKRRKRYGTNDSRGRLADKRHISERPTAVESRDEIGHWEIDTVIGRGKPCIVTLVERATGYVMIGKLNARTVVELNRATIALISKAPLPVTTITADNGTEFHGYRHIEAVTGVRFYFANPYHSWERGSNENANGLIRQYLPKKTSMARTSQRRCHSIAHRLNTRPRKRYNYRTPREEYVRRCD